MVLAVPSAALTKRVSQGCRDPNHDSVSGYQCADCLREHRYVDVDMSDHRCGTETCLAMAVVDIPLAHHSSLGRARDHLHTAEELHGRKPRDRLPRGLDGVAAAVELVDVPVTVMVVLDACTDHSEEVIPQWVHVLSVSARNVGAARAAGFLAAAPAADPGTWLATTDADCVVPERWLVKQVNHHAAAVESAVGTVVVDWRVSYTDTA